MWDNHIVRTGLPTKFETFRQNIELTESQRSQIISSHLHLRENILQGMNFISSTFLTGSYKRRTMIRPPNDVDIFIEVNYQTYDITPQAVLNLLKRELQSTYPNTSIRQGKPCIVVNFNHCTYDLTPAICNYGRSYYIPSYSSNSWQLVDSPNSIETRLSLANKNNSGMLTPLIKMMKKCREYNNYNNLKSYQMEEIAIDNIFCINSYRAGVEKLLESYQWKNWQEISQIKMMTDNEFASYCRITLFGVDFPI